MQNKELLLDLLEKIEESKNIELPSLRFADIMQGLGFRMDSYQSFEEYAKGQGSEAIFSGKIDGNRRLALELLMNAPAAIVGNYLFSYWRDLTHWSYGYERKEVDHLIRALEMLITKC